MAQHTFDWEEALASAQQNAWDVSSFDAGTKEYWLRLAGMLPGEIAELGEQQRWTALSRHYNGLRLQIHLAPLYSLAKMPKEEILRKARAKVLNVDTATAVIARAKKAMDEATRATAAANAVDLTSDDTEKKRKRPDDDGAKHAAGTAGADAKKTTGDPTAPDTPADTAPLEAPVPRDDDKPPATRQRTRLFG